MSLFQDKSFTSAISFSTLRLLISIRPNNLIEIVRRVYDCLLQFSKKVVYSEIPTVLTFINLMTMIVSICHEPQHWEFCRKIFWNLDSSSNEPFGKKILHLIMNLAFLQDFSVNVPPKERKLQKNNVNEINSSVIWFSLIYYSE